MNIELVEKGTICHYCHQDFNGLEEAWINELTDGSNSYYHLRCGGKLFVYRIEGVLPPHLFRALVKELQNPLPLELRDRPQVTLDAFIGEEE